MNRLEIIEMFRTENPTVTARVISDALLHSWCKLGDKEVCARTRCIVDIDGTTISTTENDQSYDLTEEIDKFFDIDEYPGGGVSYDDDRLDLKTIAELDDETPRWRTRSAGTPKYYYRRGPRIWFDRPIDGNEEDLTIYSVLISDDFDDDIKTPYNELTYLESYHYGIIKFLQWKAKEKKRKPQEASKAKLEFEAYTAWMWRMLGGQKYQSIRWEMRK